MAAAPIIPTAGHVQFDVGRAEDGRGGEEK